MCDGRWKGEDYVVETVLAMCWRFAWIAFGPTEMLGLGVGGWERDSVLVVGMLEWRRAACLLAQWLVH